MLIKKIEIIQKRISYNNDVRTIANTLTVYWVSDIEVRISEHFILITGL